MAHRTAAPTRPPVLLSNPAVSHRWGRSAAVLALACLIAHLPLIVSHVTAAPVSTAAMAIVSLACIPCARRLWTAPTAQDCAVAAALASVMVGVHLLLGITMAGPTAPPSPDMPIAMHQHGGVPVTHELLRPGPLAQVPHHMAMSGAVEVIFYLASAMALAQIALNVAAVALVVRREKASAPAPLGQDTVSPW